jgi:hypothetical protein
MSKVHPTILSKNLPWGADDDARDEVVMLVYDELRRIAHRYVNGERIGHTLHTTPAK